MPLPDFSVLTPEQLQMASQGGEIPPESSQTTNAGNDPTLLQRFGMAGVGGIAGGLTGGPLGAGIGALAGGLFPPRDLTDTAIMATGELAGAGYKALEAADAIKSPLVRALARMGIGLTHEGVNAAERAVGNKLTGDNQPVTSPLSMATMGLAPILAGGLGDATKLTREKQEKQVLQKSLQETADKITGQPNTPLTAEGLNTGIKISPDTQAMFDSMGKQVVKGQNDQKALQAVQKTVADAQKERVKLLAQSAPPNPVDYAKSQAQYMKMAKQANVVAPEDTHIENLKQTQADLQLQNKKGLMSDGSFQAQNATLDQQINQLQNQKLSRIADQYRQAAYQNVQDNLALNTQTQASLDKQVKQIQDEINSNPLQDVHLKALIGNTDGTPITAQEYAKRLVSMDADTANAAYKYFSKQKSGDGAIKDIQDTVISQFFQQAYDQKGKTWAKGADLMKPGAPFNRAKWVALWGGGQEGEQAADQFGKTVADLRRLTEINTAQIAAKNSSALDMSQMTKFAVAAPTALLLSKETGHVAAGLAELGVVYLPQLVQKAIQNPGFANALHKFAQSGTVADFSPMLSNYLTNNAPSLGGI